MGIEAVEAVEIMDLETSVYLSVNTREVNHLYLIRTTKTRALSG